MDANDLKSDLGISPIWLVVAAVLLWSTGGLFIKFTTVDAVTVNLGRALFAAITVALFTFRKGLKLNGFTLLSSLLYATTLSAFVYANKNTTAANAIFLQYTAPIYILAFAPLVLKERFVWKDLITVIFCLAGMSLFFLDSGGNTGDFAPNPLAGNIAGLVSGLCFGLYFVMLRHPRSLKLNPALSVFYGNLIIVLVMLPMAAVSPPSLTAPDVLAIVFLGVFQIGAAYILFTHGLSRGVRSLDASIIGFIEPLLNPVWVFLFLGESPSGWALLGGAIILTGVLGHTLFVRNDRRRGRVQD